jgi:hypothetical protein
MPNQPKKPTKRVNGSSGTPLKQHEGGPPVVDQPQAHRMGEVEIGPRRIGRRIVTMVDDPPPPKQSKATMDPMPSRRPRPKSDRPTGDQKPLPAEASVAEGPGYLRLRFGVVGDEVQLKGARFVPGPFERPQVIAAGLAFDARVGRRPGAAGNIPDPTEHRSFPDPAGRAGMDGHHITQVDDFDFTVRLATNAIDPSELGHLRIDVFRWRGNAPGDRLAPGEMRKLPKAAVERVVEVSGIEPKALSTKVRRELESAVRDLKR